MAYLEKLVEQSMRSKVLSSVLASIYVTIFAQASMMPLSSSLIFGGITLIAGIGTVGDVSLKWLTAATITATLATALLTVLSIFGSSNAMFDVSASMQLLGVAVNMLVFGVSYAGGVLFFLWISLVYEGLFNSR